MSGEAYRWTAKTPSELYHTLGPHGVDHLVRQMLDVCWRESPDEGRSLAGVKRAAGRVFDRNISVWARIKQPSPAAFFENLLPNAADGFMRQAMVMCWMMMPRAGGRHVADVRKIVGEIYQRNIAAWDADEATFTGTKRNTVARARAKPGRSMKRAKPATGKPATGKPAKSKSVKRPVRPGPKRSR
ncbi:MAG TPA: hypothetical protein VIM11_21030 [Tepidisphaeraceae bacterium]|jgi:hypothetical protein